MRQAPLLQLPQIQPDFHIEGCSDRHQFRPCIELPVAQHQDKRELAQKAQDVRNQNEIVSVVPALIPETTEQSIVYKL